MWGLIFAKYGSVLWKLSVLIVIVAFVVISLHARDQSFVRQGMAKVQAKWDAEAARIAKLSAEQTAASQAIEAQNRARNQEVVNDLAHKLDAVVADRDVLYRRLRALTTPGDHPGQVPGAAVPAGDIPASGHGGDATLDGLLADALAECRANAARQDAMMDSLALK